MPANADFAFEILVGGFPLPEYEKDGKMFIECNLATPVSYKQKMSETVQGEVEEQEWPVTPYRIKVIGFTREMCYLRVFVDGVKVKGLGMKCGDVKLIKGFRDNAVLREFLFSMPRFARNEHDRLQKEREVCVGSIEVECWRAELRKTNWELREKRLDFDQANKKDCYKVTGGAYTLATSRAGRVVSSRALFRNVDSWKRISIMSTLKVTYHMGHTLQEMGLSLKPLNIRPPPKQRSSRRKSSSSNSDQSRCVGSLSLVSTSDGSPAEGTSGATAIKKEVDSEQNNVVPPSDQVGAGSAQEPITIDLSSDEDL